MSASGLNPFDLEAPGTYATYRGKEYAAIGHTTDPWITLYMDRSEWLVFSSPDEVSRSEPGSRRLSVTVRDTAVDRLFARGWVATWSGVEVAVEPVDTDHARIHYDEDPDLARMLGLSGSQQEGFTGTVPYAELEDLRVVTRELPVRRHWLDT